MYSNLDDYIRNEVVIRYNKLLNKEYISRSIEKGIYNYIIDLAKEKNIKRNWSNDIFLGLYLLKVRSIYSNINEDSYIGNKTFKQRILTGNINENNISKLTTYDIFPENWKDFLEYKTKRDKLKLEYKPEAMTDQYKCRKCGSRSTSYYEVQTRSADEPMTQFITCLNCNCRWKQ